MTQRSVLHTSFVIERQFKASPKRVFAAWTDPQAKRRWSDCHADLSDNDYSLDFRPGGAETHRVVMPDGSVQLVQKQFFDIVPNARIVFGYDIQLDARRLSVSLVTVQFEPSRAGTHMTMTEYVAYLDGQQDLEERIRGTNEGLDRLELELQSALPVQ
jgi:uncharacterized protein YndB with AHSA1/START domain